MSLQYHLKLAHGDVAPYVLLPGDPGRVPLVASLWDESREVASNREYVTFTGTYRGVPISCTSTGIGCPSTAIAMEELARVGATTFVRIGTCGTFQDRVHTGDMAIFDSAARYDGASRLYAPIEFPAVASHEVVAAAIEAGERLGTVPRRHDPLGRHLLRDAPSAGFVVQRLLAVGWREHFDDLKRLNVVAAEMEASVILVLARIWGLRAGGIAVVLDNVLRVSGDSGQFDPRSSSTTAATRSSGSRAWAPRSSGSWPSGTLRPNEPRDVSTQYHVKLAPATSRRTCSCPATRAGAGRRLALGRGPRGRPQPRVRDLHGTYRGRRSRAPRRGSGRRPPRSRSRSSRGWARRRSFGSGRADRSRNGSASATSRSSTRRLATTGRPGCTRRSSSRPWPTTAWSPRGSRRPTVRA